MRAPAAPREEGSCHKEALCHSSSWPPGGAEGDNLPASEEEEAETPAFPGSPSHHRDHQSEQGLWRSGDVGPVHPEPAVAAPITDAQLAPRWPPAHGVGATAEGLLLLLLRGQRTTAGTPPRAIRGDSGPRRGLHHVPTQFSLVGPCGRQGAWGPPASGHRLQPVVTPPAAVSVAAADLRQGAQPSGVGLSAAASEASGRSSGVCPPPSSGAGVAPEAWLTGPLAAVTLAQDSGWCHIV